VLFGACNISLDDSDGWNRFNGNVVLNSQADINELGNKEYNEITGYLHIGSYTDDGQMIFPYVYDTDITDLSPLNSIERIRGNLLIRGNPILSELNGLKNLKIVEGYLIQINFNESLTTINGLNNLEFIGRTIHIIRNDMLSYYCGLQTLFENNINLDYEIGSNAYNPTLDDINSANCSQ